MGRGHLSIRKLFKREIMWKEKIE